MAFDGNGTFNRPVSPYVFDTVISETDVNAEMDGIATGLSICLTTDGQSTTTARIDFAQGIATDTISELTGGAGVTIDGVLLKDGNIDADKIDGIQGADIASAATLNLETATGNIIDVTGTTTITAVTLGQGHERLVRFTGALILTNGANLVLPGGANITTAAGDYALFVGYGSSVVRVAGYWPAANYVSPTRAINTTAPLGGGGDLSANRTLTFDAPLFQCRLTKVSTNLQLDRFSGSWLFINGVNYQIPQAGITVSPSGASPTVNYYIYAYMNSGTMTLEAVTTAPAIDATYGHAIKTGDAFRSLVGFARAITGPAWVDSPAQRLVRSYYNDPGVGGANVFTTNRTVTGTNTAMAEINSEIRCEFLSWDGETLTECCSTAVSNSNGAGAGGNISIVGISLDGTFSNPGDASTIFSSPGVGFSSNLSCSGVKTGMTRGFHYVTLFGAIAGGAGTVTYSSSWTTLSYVLSGTRVG